MTDKSDLLDGLPKNVQDDEDFRRLYKLEPLGIISKSDMQYISVGWGSDAFLFIGHDQKGDPAEDMHFGYYDFTGKVTETMPDELKQVNGWYPQSGDQRVHQYFLEYCQ